MKKNAPYIIGAVVLVLAGYAWYKRRKGESPNGKPITGTCEEIANNYVFVNEGARTVFLAQCKTKNATLPMPNMVLGTQEEVTRAEKDCNRGVEQLEKRYGFKDAGKKEAYHKRCVKVYLEKGMMPAPTPHEVNL